MLARVLPDMHTYLTLLGWQGDGDNGKWLCGVRSLLQRPGCIVYSVGSNGDVSFEQVRVH